MKPTVNRYSFRTEATGRFRLVHAGLLALSFAVFGSGSMAQTPAAAVKATIDEVIDVLSSRAAGPEHKRQEVLRLISARFDLEKMSQSVLAGNWRQASAEQKQRFVALFSQLLGKIYWLRISEYTDEHVEYTREKIKHDKLAQVDTVIVSGDSHLPINYKLHKKQTGWYAYDLIVEAISLVNTYRANFQDIVKNEGMDGLLAKMQQKVDE